MQTPITTISGKGVYITNEGGFTYNNASVSFFDSKTGVVVQDIYKKVNQIPLGDVCQSMTMFNTKTYIVVNNSSKVEVVNMQDFLRTSTITGFTSPRYLLPVSNNKAYVTDLYANAITIVDLSSNSISGNIPIKKGTEQLTIIYGHVFVTHLFSNQLYVINAQQDVVEDSITVGYGASSLQQDKNGKLWVLCSGDSLQHLSSALYKINPITKVIEHSFIFSGNNLAWRLTMNGNKDTLYFLNKDVYRMSITDMQLPPTPFIAAGNRMLYGLGVEPSSGDVYVSDAIDYAQRGKVFRYQNDGMLIQSFLAGIIPGDFYFN